MAYSVPPRRNERPGIGLPMPSAKRCTQMPAHLAARKCPTSWTKTRTPSTTSRATMVWRCAHDISSRARARAQRSASRTASSAVAGCTPWASSTRVDGLGDPAERNASAEERRDGDLVGRVEHRGGGAARAPGRHAGGEGRGRRRSGPARRSARPRRPDRTAARRRRPGAPDGSARTGSAAPSSGSRAAPARCRRRTPRRRARCSAGAPPPRCGRRRSPKRKCASITSSALLASVALSTEILLPMLPGRVPQRLRDRRGRAPAPPSTRGTARRTR